MITTSCQCGFHCQIQYLFIIKSQMRWRALKLLKSVNIYLLKNERVAMLKLNFLSLIFCYILSSIYLMFDDKILVEMSIKFFIIIQWWKRFISLLCALIIQGHAEYLTVIAPWTQSIDYYIYRVKMFKVIFRLLKKTSEI